MTTVIRSASLRAAAVAGVLLLVATAAPAPAQPAQAQRCRPGSSFAYGSERAVYRFSFPRCGRPRSTGAMRVTVELERCAESCQAMTKRVLCRQDVPCRVVLRMPHPVVEVATYTADAVYRSSGERVIAGTRTVATSCAAAGPVAFCF